MQERNEPGGATNGSNMIAGKKGGGHSGGSTTIAECSTPEQVVVRSEAPTMATED